MSAGYALHERSLVTGLSAGLLRLGELDPDEEQLYFRSLAASGYCLELIADRIEGLMQGDGGDVADESEEIIRLLRFLHRTYMLCRK